MAVDNVATAASAVLADELALSSYLRFRRDGHPAGAPMIPSSRQPVGSAVNDVTDNYVLSNAVTSKVLNELALADALTSLPLKWGAISAYRLGRNIRVEWNTRQESDVSHFTIERSTNALDRTVVLDNVAATNTAFSHEYAVIDNYYNA